MSDDCKFQEHITKVAFECKRITAMILRAFRTRDAEIMKSLLKVLIISRLDYCSPLYMPERHCEKQALEQVQAYFTSRIDGMRADNVSSCNYWERLQRLKLYSIERRHERYAAMYVWKCKHGIVRNPGFTFSISLRRGVRTYLHSAVGESEIALS